MNNFFGKSQYIQPKKIIQPEKTFLEMMNHLLEPRQLKNIQLEFIRGKSMQSKFLFKG